MSTKGISEGNIPQGRFSTAELQHHSQLPGPIVWGRPRIPRRQRSADSTGLRKSRPHHGTPVVGWSPIGNRPIDSVPWKILRRKHDGTIDTLEPRRLSNAVSLVSNDRQRSVSRRSPQHHDCEVTGPQLRCRYSSLWPVIMQNSSSPLIEKGPHLTPHFSQNRLGTSNE